MMKERTMKDMVAGVHLSYCNQGEYVGRCKLGADDCPALEQKDKCPRCKGGKSIWLGGNSNVFSPCPECIGTGEKKLDSPDREKIFETIYYHKFPNAVRYKVKPIMHDIWSEELADQIQVLFPDIEEAKKENAERVDAMMVEAMEKAVKQENRRMIRILKDASYALDENTWQALGE